MPMFKTSIFFPRPQEVYLRAEAERLGISISDVVRRIVSREQEAKEANSPQRVAGTGDR